MSEHSPLDAYDPHAARGARKGPPVWAWVIVAGVVTLVVAVIIVMLFLRSGQQPATPPAQPSPSPSETATPSPTVSPSPTTTPTPSPTAPAAIVIPDCALLNPAAQTENDAFVNRPDVDVTHGDIGRGPFNEVFGPAAIGAMNAAAQSRGCAYIFSFHDGMYQFTSKIDAAGRAPLVQAVEADADFVESGYRGARIFSWQHPASEGPSTASDYTIHAFIGDIWIASRTVMNPTQAVHPTIDAMIAANPGLG